jgi:hypothetical protein
VNAAATGGFAEEGDVVQPEVVVTTKPRPTRIRIRHFFDFARGAPLVFF